MQRLKEKCPARYQLQEDGSWRCPPGEAYAESLGLAYRVRSSAELHPTLIQNLMFLEDYFGSTVTVPVSVQARVLDRVHKEPGITLAALLAAELGVRANDVYVMLTQEQLYADLSAVPLVEHWRLQLYPDQQTHKTHSYLGLGQTQFTGSFGRVMPTQLVTNTKLLWDGRLWTLVNWGETTTTLKPEVGQPMQLPTDFFLQLLERGSISSPEVESEPTATQEVHSLMAAASPTDLREANRRYELVQAYFQHQADLEPGIARRTMRRWVKQFREAEANYGCGYVGLLPRTAQRGNRMLKVPPASREFLDSFIAEHFDTARLAPAASVYRAYQRACAGRNIVPLSARTFYQRLKQRSCYEQTEKRQGAKAAYTQQPWVWELTKSTPRHGDRPLAIVHIDHTQLDIELRCSATGRLLGRPWLTLLIDAYSRRVLAVYLTFDAPSYRSCMMGLRICVQRCGRFPQAVVVDGGKEFHSVYSDTLLARYHCTKKTRPGAKPRFGSVIERLFGTTNTEFVFNLLGNTQAAKQVRLLTKATDPKRQAVWTLGDLYSYLSEWAYQIYDQDEHEALGMTPREMYTLGLTQAGEREHRCIPYNEEFLMATRPSPLKGLALVQPGRGIKVNYLYYWSDAFRNPEVERTKVPIRYDPFDISVAYAYLEGRWVKCISQYYSTFVGRSEKELLLASHEIRQQGKFTRTSTAISAKRLADFLANVQEHEALLLQRLRDSEGKQVLNALTEKPSNVHSDKTVLPDLPSVPSCDTPKSELPAQVSAVDLARLPVFEEYH